MTSPVILSLANIHLGPLYIGLTKNKKKADLISITESRTHILAPWPIVIGSSMPTEGAGEPCLAMDVTHPQTPRGAY